MLRSLFNDRPRLIRITLRSLLLYPVAFILIVIVDIDSFLGLVAFFFSLFVLPGVSIRDRLSKIRLCQVRFQG